MGIKAVVFDYGKVICFSPGEEVQHSLAALAGVPAELFESLRWKYRDEYDRGTVNGTDYYRGILVSAGLRPEEPVIEEMLQIDMDSWKNLNPATVRLMEDVKAAGLKLGILSNMPHDFLAFIRATFPLFGLPDAGIFSCETGSIKPEEKIYRVLLEALGCVPEETVFFDDIERNVKKAKDLGIRGFVWQTPEAARRELQNLGLRF